MRWRRALASLVVALGACDGGAACPDAGDDASAIDAFVDEPDAAFVSVTLAAPETEWLEACGVTESSIELDAFGTTATGPLSPTIEGPDAAAFAISTTTCASGIAPGGHCTVTVAHTSVATQNRYTAALHVVVGARTYGTLLRAARGSDCEAQPSVGPDHDFGSVPVGTTVSTVLSIENVGRTTTGVLTVTFVGTGAAAYAIVPGSDHCTGTTLDFRTQCTVEVSFSPTAVGHAGVAVRAITTGENIPAVLTGSGT